MVEIETSRLLLRAFKPGDLDELYLIRCDPDVMKTLPAVRPRSREETLLVMNRHNERWGEQHFGVWAVEYKEHRKLIGYCGLQYLEDTPEVEVLYGLAKAYWGGGLITEAARGSLRYGFEEAGLNHIVAIALPDNLASRRVMEKMGMRYEGKTRNFGVDCVRYTIVKEEFEPQSTDYTLRHV
jgi:ribosomal-protein-alanine N-acetyltransferase